MTAQEYLEKRGISVDISYKDFDAAKQAEVLKGLLQQIEDRNSTVETLKKVKDTLFILLQAAKVIGLL